MADLVAYENNPRTHSEAQVAQLAACIQEFGYTNPILLDGQNGVIAGHGRLLAAQQLGLEKVPCIELSHLSDAQKRAYVIADNKLALNAGWDEHLLGLEIDELSSLGFDLEMTGFTLDEIDELQARNGRRGGKTDPDDVPEVDADVVSQAGDLWVCGKHRVLCGDSTSADDVAKVLDGVEPHLMVTDPPYGVEYDPDWRNRSALGWSKSRALGKVEADDRADWREAWVLFPGDVVYVWHPAGAKSVEFYQGLLDSGFEIRMQIIWAKPHYPISRGHYHVQHEPCWYAVRKSKAGHWAGDRKQSTLWQIDNATAFRGKRNDGDERTGHGTQKPVECMRRPIVNNSSPGQAVYDPFLGSGTTMIAAEMEARVCYGLEIAPQYVDVIVRRWQDFTGEEAKHEDGRTFAEVERERIGDVRAA